MTKFELINKCGELLSHRGLKLAFAESATAGRLTSEFAATQQAGDFLLGGVCCYNVAIKDHLLKVEPAIIEKFTPESAKVTELITIGLGKLFNADICIGCTGLITAGGSETKKKPVGTMFFHAIYKDQTLFKERIVFGGTPESILEESVMRVATLLINCLGKESNASDVIDKRSDEWSVSWP